MGRGPGNGAGDHRRGGITPKSVAQVLQRYCDEISPRNKGHRWERVRIARFLKEEADLCAKLIHTISTADLGAWRDRRLAQVQPVSVRRDIALLRAAWGYARREWRNLKDEPLAGPDDAARGPSS